MKMRFASQDWVLISSAIVLLPLLGTPLSHTSWKNEENIKEAVFLSPKFELGPGSVLNKFYYDIDFPRGHVAIKSFNAEVVDEEGNSIPLHETYLHHWLVIRYHQPKGSKSHNLPVFDDPDAVIVRNSGMCQDNSTIQYFGIGSETRGTATDIPDPFGIQVGNPEEIAYGYEERWMLNVHAIDTRGVEDRMGCTECRCDLYNVTMDQFGHPLRSDYYRGGILCCFDKVQCKLREGFGGPKRSLHLRYTVKWVDWDNSIVPVKIYMVDVTDSVQVLNGSKAMNTEHNCRLEYEVEPCSNQHKGSSDCIDIKKTSVPMSSGGYVIYVVAHQHAGGIGSTLYGQDGRIICSSKPSYGSGEEAGNEAGYIVGMSTCYPEPGSIQIFDGEILTMEFNYNSSQRHTGVMGVFYLLVAEKLPDQPSMLFSHTSLPVDKI